MELDVFVPVLINLHDKRSKSYLKRKYKRYWSSKWDCEYRNISGTIKDCLDIQVKRYRWTKKSSANNERCVKVNKRK